MKLLLGMDSWSGLGKIINDIKRNFEDYDLDDVAAAHFANDDYAKPELPTPPDLGTFPSDRVSV